MSSRRSRAAVHLIFFLSLSLMVAEAAHVFPAVAAAARGSRPRGFMCHTNKEREREREREKRKSPREREYIHAVRVFHKYIYSPTAAGYRNGQGALALFPGNRGISLYRKYRVIYTAERRRKRGGRLSGCIKYAAVDEDEYTRMMMMLRPRASSARAYRLQQRGG